MAIILQIGEGNSCISSVYRHQHQPAIAAAGVGLVTFHAAIEPGGDLFGRIMPRSDDGHGAIENIGEECRVRGSVRADVQPEGQGSGSGSPDWVRK